MEEGGGCWEVMEEGGGCWEVMEEGGGCWEAGAPAGWGGGETERSGVARGVLF